MITMGILRSLLALVGFGLVFSTMVVSTRMASHSPVGNSGSRGILEGMIDYFRVIFRIIF